MAYKGAVVSKTARDCELGKWKVNTGFVHEVRKERLLTEECVEEIAKTLLSKVSSAKRWRSPEDFAEAKWTIADDVFRKNRNGLGQLTPDGNKMDDINAYALASLQFAETEHDCEDG